MTDLLQPFQIRGAEWLADHCRGLLADPMGLGKTPQAIHAADRVGARRVLVSCPAIGKTMWRRQFERWSVMRPELVVESYDRLATNKKLRAQIRGWRPDVWIGDEAHYLKSTDAKRTKAIYGSWCHGNGLAGLARWQWPLTGTPCPNHAGELYPLMRAMFPDHITHGGETLNYAGFIERYCLTVPGTYGLKAVGNKNAPELRAILAQIMLRRKADEWSGPPIFWQPPTLIESDEALAELAAYEESDEGETFRRVVDAAIADDARSLWAEDDPLAFATIRRITATLKAPIIARLIADELEAGAYYKIVIFGVHRAALALVAEALAEYGVAQFVGGQTERARQSEIDAFQSSPAVRVGIAQLDAAHHTITLTAAEQVAFIEQLWTPDKNAQAAKRVHRMGQTRPVFVRTFALAGSVDEAVQTILGRKARNILELMGH